MAQLYPPIISGTLPAFYLENSNLDRSIKITVPFTMNRAVSASQVKGFALKIKTVQNSTYLYTALTYDSVNFKLEGSSYVTFILKTSNNSSERELLLKTLKVGLFYKLQLAYIDQNNEVGNYSTVGVCKFTTRPTVSIKDLKTNTTNNHIFSYMGIYDQTGGDSSEKVHSYCFNLYDENDDIIATTGEKVHNTTIDVDLYQSYDEFEYTKDLDPYYTYKLQYYVITSNNLKVYSPLYRISSKITIDSDLKAEVYVKPHFADGYIQVDLNGIMDSEGNEYITTGSFVLSRSCEDDNYTAWEKLSTFKLIAEFPSRSLWKDFTVEQGKSYKYAIQQYNDNGLYSTRITSNEVFADFEDSFLYDGERQLKIRYNPKLGNIKTNLQESKIDTMGHKYPFFFRNGEINYKEFTIAGLLSFLGDENFFFINKNDLKLNDELHRHDTHSMDKLIDPVSNNIANERIFKTQVLDWLNNGKPKLFRSPHEGNFIVRLMKVTLNPENKLGRLLHSFNCTAYEIDKYNYDNLQKYNFVTITHNQDLQYLSWKTIYFKRDENGYLSYPINKVLNDSPTNQVKFIDMRPGQMVKLVFENGKTEIIVIGPTGSYALDSKHTIAEISLLESNLKYQDGIEDQYLTGSMTYSFIDTTPNEFNKISMVENISIPVQQFVGQHDDILAEIQGVYDDTTYTWVKNPKHELLKVFHIKCRKREIEYIVREGSNLYQGQTGLIYEAEKANHANLVQIGEYKQIAEYNPIRREYKFNPIEYVDFYNNITYSLEDYQPYVYINGNQISVENISEFDFEPDELTSLSCGNGAIVELTYYMKNTDYKIEDNDNYPDVYNAKQYYLLTKNRLENYYYILGVLGSYQGGESEVYLQLSQLTKQLTEDEEKAISPYNDQIATLKENYIILQEENQIAHENKLAYINSRIQELEVNGILPEEQRILRQYQEALYVEQYEYARLTEKRDQDHQRQLDNLEGKIINIQLEYATELEYLKEQSEIQLQTVKKKRQEVLSLALELFGNNSSWDDNTWVESLEQSLITENNLAYTNYILGLIKAQEIQVQEEAVNDR